jgi:murein L,D-transpeptidase YafK
MRIQAFALAAILFLPMATAADLGEPADQIVVNKSKHQLLLLRSGKVIRSYRVALGWHPVGTKIEQGDGKTPEGDYTISGRNPKSSYHLSLRISYPSDADIARAKRDGVDPGGDIMIHGLPNGEENVGVEHTATDWTAGCVAVTDREIEEIWRLVPDGTPIRINP